MPARPENVSGSPPSATPRRASSASPRVMSAAFVLSPYPRPAAMPAAIAIDVLERTRDLAAHDVGVRVDAEGAGHEELLELRRGLLVSHRDDGRGGLPLRDLASRGSAP